MANEKGIHCAGLINILPEVDAMFQQAIQTSICSYDSMINLQGHLRLFFYWPRLLSIVAQRVWSWEFSEAEVVILGQYDSGKQKPQPPIYMFSFSFAPRAKEK